MFVRGRDGYYFLSNDSNDVLAQTEGRLRLEPALLDAIRGAHEERVDFAGAIGAEYYHLVAPNKETVYRRFLPSEIIFEKRGPVPLRRYLRRCPDVARFTYYDPDLLRPDSGAIPTYPRTDTHWTTHGAITYLRSFARRFGVAPLSEGLQALRLETKQDDVKGDLGVHADLPPERYLNTTIRNPAPILAFHGNIINEGLVIHANSSNPRAQGRVLVIHDSFTYVLLPAISFSFKDAMFIHTPDLDFSFVRAFAPDLILFIQAERFFPRPIQNGIALPERLIELAATKQRPDVTSGYIKSILEAPNPIERASTQSQRVRVSQLRKLLRTLTRWS